MSTSEQLASTNPSQAGKNDQTGKSEKSETENFRVIVVDDDKEMRESLTHLLNTANWQVKALSRAEDTNKCLAEFDADVILSDVRMPGMSGLDLLMSLKSAVIPPINTAAIPGPTSPPNNTPPIVLISAHGDIPMAVEAMQNGAYSFIEKPTDPRRILTVLKNAAERHRLTQNTTRLKARLANLSGLDRVLLGNTQSIKTLREDIIDLGDSDAAIMILGETGTGKELVARALHNLSPRMTAPFLVINCATIPIHDFEETMFGTMNSKQGMLSRVNGGTLFLDEFSTCPIEIQAKFLRLIEHKEFNPTGSDKPQKLNIRIISASNEQMDIALKEGRFREDLYYRLNTVILPLPPLRERLDDITLLYEHFTSQYGELYEVIPPEITAEDLTALMSHHWPGNVRELRNVAERRILMAKRGRGSVPEALHLDSDFDDVPETLREAVAAFERLLIAKALKAHQGRMDAVAEALGIARRTLNEKIVKLGLNKEDFL